MLSSVAVTQPTEPMSTTITLPTPHEVEAAQWDPQEEVFLVAQDRRTGFIVPRSAMLVFSYHFQRLVDGREHIDTVPEPCFLLPQGGKNPVTNEETPGVATPKVVQVTAAWLLHHGSRGNELSGIGLPMVQGDLKTVGFSDWDLALCRLMCPDMHDPELLVDVAGLATFLDIPLLLEMTSAYVAWHIRKAHEEATPKRSAVATVRGWFGEEEEDLSEKELQELHSEFAWMKNTNWLAIEDICTAAYRDAKAALGFGCDSDSNGE